MSKGKFSTKFTNQDFLNMKQVYPVLTIKYELASQIVSNELKVLYRRTSQFKHFKGREVVLHAKKPVNEVLGVGTVKEVKFFDGKWGIVFGKVRKFKPFKITAESNVWYIDLHEKKAVKKPLAP